MAETTNEATFSEQEKQKKGKIKKETLIYSFRMIKEAGVPKFLLIISVLMSIAGAGIGLVVPLRTGDLIDAIGTGNINWPLILLLLGLFISENIVGSVSWYLLAYIGQDILYNIRKNLWLKVLALPISFFDKYRSAETMSRVTNDTNEINTLFTSHLVTLASSLTTVIGGIILLFRIDWQMAFIILLAVPIGILLIMPIGGKMYKISIDTYTKLAELTTILTQTISEMRLVKASNAEKHEEQDGLEKMRELFHFGLKEARINAILGPLMSTVMLLMLVIVIGYGGVRVASGVISAGELVSFILLIFQIIWPFTEFAGFYTQLQKVMGATERLKVILDYTPERLASGELPVPSNDKDLTFEEVSFSYVSDEPVLKNLSFNVPAGKMTAFVGPSGSGKSTVFSLIEQFYLPDSGNLLYGDDPIPSFDLENWRRKIGYVSQDSSLMTGTIRNNILYGQNEDIPEEMVVEAAKMAYADNFIEEFSNKYDTEVGERGIQLSGGQRQRIAIARAFLRQPEILLLDEATASLDSESESQIQQALEKLMHGRTTLVIAHRLSTVVKADQIVVIEKGEVTGTGTHEELIVQHPTYVKWAKKQLNI